MPDSRTLPFRASALGYPPAYDAKFSDMVLQQY